MKVYMLNKDQQWENQGMTSSYVELLKGMSLLVRFDKMWSTRKGNDKPLQHFCLENPMSSMKRQKDMTLKDDPSLPLQVARCPIYY